MLPFFVTALLSCGENEGEGESAEMGMAEALSPDGKQRNIFYRKKET